MIPYLCPELPTAQKEALAQAGQDAAGLYQRGVAQLDGVQEARRVQRSTRRAATTRRSRSIRRSISATMPARVRPTSRCWSTWCARRAQPGLPERDQNRAGRADLFNTTFETFERNIREPAGPHPRRGRLRSGARYRRASPSIAGRTAMRTNITAVRSGTPPEAQQPHVIGRARFGCIAIANSDSGAAAYTDSAIDQAYRAIQELLQT